MDGGYLYGHTMIDETALRPPTVAKPSRTFNTNFKPSDTRTVRVTYLIYLNTGSVSANSSAEAKVELRSDANGTPTTRRDAILVKLTRSNLTLGTEAVELMGSVSYDVPAGHFVRLVYTQTGTASAILDEVTEETL